MTTVARALFFARRRVSDAWGVAVAVGFAALLAAGALSWASVWRGDLWVLTALGIYSVAVGRAVVREVSPSAVGRAQRTNAATRELEMGLLLIVGAYVVVALTGTETRWRMRCSPRRSATNPPARRSLPSSGLTFHRFANAWPIPRRTP